MSSINWRTTLAGVGALLTAAGHLTVALSHGDTSTIPTDFAAIIAAIGLLAAKDHNK